jgi:hypothetical protein
MADKIEYLWDLRRLMAQSAASAAQRPGGSARHVAETRSLTGCSACLCPNSAWRRRSMRWRPITLCGATWLRHWGFDPDALARETPLSGAVGDSGPVIAVWTVRWG